MGVPEETPELQVAADSSERRLQGTNSGAAIMIPEDDGDDAAPKEETK